MFSRCILKQLHFQRVSSFLPQLQVPGNKYSGSKFLAPLYFYHEASSNRQTTINSLHLNFSKIIAKCFLAVAFSFSLMKFVSCEEKENELESSETNSTDPSKSLKTSTDEQEGTSNNKHAVKTPEKLPTDEKLIAPKVNESSKWLLTTLPNVLPKGMKVLPNITLRTVEDFTKSVIIRKMAEHTAPGLSIVVSVNGEVVYSYGIGCADLENFAEITPQTKLRIASISKPLTAVAAFRLHEEGKLDLDAPIQNYIKSFPIKKVDDKEVTLTLRQLLSHTSGIRHYQLKGEKPKKKQNIVERQKSENDTDDKRQYIRNLLAELAYHNIKKRRDMYSDQNDFNNVEFYINEKFSSVKQALELFQDDELFFTPGQDFLYSTHGFTLVSAIIESAAGQTFECVMKKLFHDLGLEMTYLENNDDIIYGRGKNYIHDNKGNLKNAPYVDNSYKYAGGGMLSSAEDINKFGNAMLFCYQNREEGKGILKQSSMTEMWTPAAGAVFKSSTVNKKYGLGWEIVEGEKKQCSPYDCKGRLMISHSGAGVGASSILLILPSEENGEDGPKGVVVSILMNMQDVSLRALSTAIALAYEKAYSSNIKTKSVGMVGNEFDIYHAANFNDVNYILY